MNTFVQFYIFAFVVLIGSVHTYKCINCITFDHGSGEDDGLRESNNRHSWHIRGSAKKIPILKSTFDDEHIANHANLKLLPPRCGAIAGDRIVGGVIADLYEFPWMAVIYYNNLHGLTNGCGGTIISKRYVLTAAHCVKDQPIASVRLGEYDISKSSDCQKNVCETHIQEIPVQYSVIHEKYNSGPPTINDIALLRLAEDVDINYLNVDFICLPTTSELRHLVLDNVPATVTGWGITESGHTSDILRKANVFIYTAENCSNLYNKYTKPGNPDVTADVLCAKSEGKDSCSGDSGGPLMVTGKYNRISRYVQFGVVSKGPLMCASNYPAIYTDVRKYMGWILDKIAP